MSSTTKQTRLVVQVKTLGAIERRVAAALLQTSASITEAGVLLDAVRRTELWRVGAGNRSFEGWLLASFNLKAEHGRALIRCGTAMLGARLHQLRLAEMPGPLRSASESGPPGEPLEARPEEIERFLSEASTTPARAARSSGKQDVVPQPAEAPPTSLNGVPVPAPELRWEGSVDANGIPITDESAQVAFQEAIKLDELASELRRLCKHLRSLEGNPGFALVPVGELADVLNRVIVSLVSCRPFAVLQQQTDQEHNPQWTTRRWMTMGEWKANRASGDVPDPSDSSTEDPFS